MTRHGDRDRRGRRAAAAPAAAAAQRAAVRQRRAAAVGRSRCATPSRRGSTASKVSRVARGVRVRFRAVRGRQGHRQGSRAAPRGQDPHGRGGARARARSRVSGLQRRRLPRARSAPRDLAGNAARSPRAPASPSAPERSPRAVGCCAPGLRARDPPRPARPRRRARHRDGYGERGGQATNVSVLRRALAPASASTSVARGDRQLNAA